MNCPKCGKPNAEERLFCGFCGSPLNTPEDAAPAHDAERALYGRPEPSPSQGARQSEVRQPEARQPEVRQPEVRQPEARQSAAQEPPPLSRAARRALRRAQEPEAPDAPDEPETPEAREEPDAADEPQAPPVQPIWRDEAEFAPPIPPRAQQPRRQEWAPLGEDEEDAFGEGAPEGDAFDEEAFGEEAPEDDAAPESPLSKPLLDKPVELRAKRPPTLTRASAPVRPRAASGPARANTATPPRIDAPEDLFMEDEVDAEDELADFVREYFDDYQYEEPAHGNFFLRHIRGFVGLTLLLLTVIIVGYWLLYGPGQRVLGQLYISSDPDTYIELGAEADAAADYETAGAYYLKALELDPDNRNCAISAANAYIRAGNSGRAAEALEYMIAADPTDPAPYVTLKQLYPDAASRPQRITQLIRQGYEQTGDERLQE